MYLWGQKFFIGGVDCLECDMGWDIGGLVQGDEGICFVYVEGDFVVDYVVGVVMFLCEVVKGCEDVVWYVVYVVVDLFDLFGI